MDAFTTAYFESALWSTNDESDEQGGEPLDKNYSISDFSEDTKRKMIRDCESFQRRAATMIESDTPTGNYSNDELAGHDFWLTRNGHGAGFRDGGWPKYGDALTKIAKEYGEFDLYVGDDGEIHGSGGREVAERRGVAASRRAASPRTRVSESGEITARTVLDELGRQLEHDGKDAARESARIARLINGANSRKKTESALEEIDKILNGHGVEAIRDENAYDNYYGDAIAEYVNMGDTYVATVLYDIRNHTWHVTSWGDWYEAYEREREANREEESEDEDEEDLDEKRGVRTPRRSHVQKALKKTGSFKFEDWKQDVIGHMGGKSRADAARRFDRYEEEMRARFRNGETSKNAAYVIDNRDSIPVTREKVRDYEVIDRQNRRTAGPFKHQSDARAAAGSAGVVRFVPSSVKERRQSKEEIPVIFRIEKEDGLTVAVFPTIPGTGSQDFAVYSAQEQHSTGSREWYENNTRPASPASYASLLANLRHVYDDSTLRVVERFSRTYDDERRKKLRAPPMSPAQQMRTKAKPPTRSVRSPKAKRSAKKKPAKRRR